MSEWISVKDHLPTPYETVLVQHTEDLYPVSAYRCYEDVASVTSVWAYESDGLEDAEIQPEHRHLPLLRDPTHWMPLPDPPE